MNLKSMPSKTILLAEDAPDLRCLIRDYLQKIGYRVFAAQDGLEALEMSRHYEAEVDLLITDLKMPRMGGQELAEELRSVRPGIRVLYMSGDTTLALPTTFLRKPFRMQDLESLVRTLLSKQVLS